MKKIALFLFFCMTAAAMHAQEYLLKSRSDTVSYCLGIVYAKGVFADSTASLLASEADRQAYLKGIEETLPDSFAPASKSFYAGAIHAVFFTDTYNSNTNAFSIPDLIQGIRDGAAQNYEKMDTTACLEILKSYKQPSWKEEITDKKLFQDASYAYGMLRMKPQIVKASMDAYDIPQEEQDIRQFAEGYESVLQQLVPPKDAHAYGQFVGRSLWLSIPNGNALGNAVSHRQLMQGLADAVSTKNPLIAPEEAEKILLSCYPPENISITPENDEQP